MRRSERGRQLLACRGLTDDRVELRRVRSTAEKVLSKQAKLPTVQQGSLLSLGQQTFASVG